MTSDVKILREISPDVVLTEGSDHNFNKCYVKWEAVVYNYLSGEYSEYCKNIDLEVGEEVVIAQVAR